MGLVYQKQLDEDTAFAVWKIEESAGQLYRELQLKAHEKAYLNGLNNGKRNLHWLSTRVLLRKMLNTSEYIDCQVDEHGKPFLANLPYQISLSHSYDYAAVMISRNNRPVGIDIELVKTKIQRIEKKFMSAAELEFIDPEHAIEHLYICWCAKEAIYKLYGKRTVSFLNHIHLEPFAYAVEGSFNASLQFNDVYKTFTVHFEKFHDYMIGYVADGKDIAGISLPFGGYETVIKHTDEK
ncbi:4'-phosphopantetheinyl transferase superfamily protein (plasmid) [Pedobacter sp. BS3]|uniref:4'-phosphopantetheinyl transferase family protein n=1 Tax=Pedobacter sp. BS3 TaxID=2567937 RepID=UPI0011F08F58|nr:4'-phosphopantetheinyl transferase superfamily protein [Pedobacter sp. BS3]TZF85672.1 4'-phosphopantetheinyl transferase superfamily protein [Pedobacter sp. BS3]